MEITKEVWMERKSVLELFFQSVVLPEEKLRLSSCLVVTAARVFVENQLSEIQQYNMIYYPAMMRLRALMKYLERQ